jgi:pilus assembly protein FimV
MNKLLPAVALTMSMLIVQSAAHALALAELQLNSGLNHTLNATIEIRSANAQELDSLNVTVNRFTDQTAGHYKWPKIKVELIRSETGKSYLKLTSEEAVREPVLNFLLELDWSTGRIKREYSLLINPQF